MTTVGPEPQALGDRDRYLPELANSALWTINAPRDVPGRSHDCRTFGPKGHSCRCQFQPPACNYGSENMATAVHPSLSMRECEHQRVQRAATSSTSTAIASVLAFNTGYSVNQGVDVPCQCLRSRPEALNSQTPLTQSLGAELGDEKIGLIAPCGLVWPRVFG